MPTVATGPAANRLRLDAIDVVRGAVMILMVLDHTRLLVHADGLTGHPLDLATTTVPLYLTRWVTHLCAPAFVLCAGLGIGLRRLLFRVPRSPLRGVHSCRRTPPGEGPP